jgi:RNA polymerase sigma factor (sigma-70 family)
VSSAVQLCPTQATPEAEAERLYEAYANMLLGYCVRRLGCRSEAEDAVQTSFLYALRALRSGVVPECESAWLHTIARNVCNWQQRTAARRGPVSGDVEVESLASAPNEEDAERLAGLREALASLPLRQREALVLREWHGVPAREIAVQLGLTAPQTHALLTRARQALAQALTAPGKAALGLGSLVYELRGQLKALLGGVSIKAATVAAIAVTGAGVTGITGAAAEESPAERAARDQAILASQAVSADELTSPTSGVVRRPGESGTAGAAGAISTPSGLRGRTITAVGPTAPDGQPDAAAAAPGGGSSTAPVPGSPAKPDGAPATKLSVDLPPVTVEVPPVTVNLPGDLLPPVQLPPVQLPAVELPPVDLPPVLPTAEVPPIEVPPVELPPVQVPSLDGDDPPLVDIPPTQLIPPISVAPKP